jgi:hypothetical protein
LDTVTAALAASDSAELTRVTVFEAKLLTQTERPEGAIASPGLLRAG